METQFIIVILVTATAGTLGGFILARLFTCTMILAGHAASDAKSAKSATAADGNLPIPKTRIKSCQTMTPKCAT